MKLAVRAAFIMGAALAGVVSARAQADVHVLAQSSDGAYQLYATPVADVFLNTTYLGAKWEWDWSVYLSYKSGGFNQEDWRSQSLDYMSGLKTQVAPWFGSYRSSLYGNRAHVFVFPVENVQYMNFHAHATSGGGYWQYDQSFVDGAGRLTPRYTDAQDLQKYGQVYAVLDADTGTFVDFFTNKFDSAQEGYGSDLNYLYYIKAQTHQFTPEHPLSGVTPAANTALVKIVNNLAGTNDTINVGGLQPGDVARVYATYSGVTLLGTGTVQPDHSDVTMEVTQLGTKAGAVYVSVTRMGMFESPRVTKSYAAESTNTAPIANAGPDRTYEATSPSGRSVVLDGTGSYDNEHDPLTWTWSGSFGTATGATPTVQLPIGSNVVTLTVSDGKLSSSDVVMIKIVDTTPPALVLPANIVVEATGGSGAAVTFVATATDIASPPPTITYSLQPGSTFPIGVTTVTVTATDTRGNFTSGAFTVTVQDTTPPELTLPSDLVLEATSPAGAVATFAGTAVDLVDGNVPVVFAPASGSTFPLGVTTVAATATDAAGNTATGTFKVTVVDTTPPTISGPGNLTIDSTSAAGASVTYTASAVDIVSGSVPVVASMPSGSVFPIGVTTVTLSATDGSGNSASITFTVTVLGPAQQVDNLKSLIAGLPLSPSEIAALTTKLDAADRSLAKGNDNAASGQLSALVNQLDAYVNSGRLSSADAAGAIAKAQNVIDQL
jgi:hypothetical protein